MPPISIYCLPYSDLLSCHSYSLSFFLIADSLSLPVLIYYLLNKKDKYKILLWLDYFLIRLLPNYCSTAVIFPQNYILLTWHASNRKPP